MSVQFIDCESFSVSYDILGLVTVTYSIMHQTGTIPTITNSITTGNRTFKGSIVSLTLSSVPRTTWYETTVVMLATTE